ncbi:MAG: ComF family protein [Phocaeicola sp.]|uniref:ComF family protein n=1 Tax=Phocaeicola sp. TaxID=2773926 RepID=UPI003F9FC40A
MTIWTNLWDLFFPRPCVICGKPLLQMENFVCLHCLSNLPLTNLHLQKDNEIEKNFWGKMPIERATSYLYYSKGGDVRNLLYELKYYGNKEIGRFLGHCMANSISLSGFFDGIDFIVPIPLHPKREKERGYNQSEWLAKGIADITHFPIHKEVLIRSSYSTTQTHKTRIERFESMRDMFKCIHPEVLKDKHILLVDDVLTTGATLVAASDAMAGVGGLRISVLTLALAGYD